MPNIIFEKLHRSQEFVGCNDNQVFVFKEQGVVVYVYHATK